MNLKLQLRNLCILFAHRVKGFFFFALAPEGRYAGRKWLSGHFELVQCVHGCGWDSLRHRRLIRISTKQLHSHSNVLKPHTKHTWKFDCCSFHDTNQLPFQFLNRARTITNTMTTSTPQTWNPHIFKNNLSTYTWSNPRTALEIIKN